MARFIPVLMVIASQCTVCVKVICEMVIIIGA